MVVHQTTDIVDGFYSPRLKSDGRLYFQFVCLSTRREGRVMPLARTGEPPTITPRVGQDPTPTSPRMPHPPGTGFPQEDFLVTGIF